MWSNDRSLSGASVDSNDDSRRLSELGRRLRHESRELVAAARDAIARAEGAVVRSQQARASGVACLRKPGQVFVSPPTGPRIW